MSETGPAAPGEITHRLLAWFFRHRRQLPWREESDPYRIWVSEIMLQQTQSSTAGPYYLRWLQRFPDLPSLAAAEEQEVLKCWEGLGYYSRGRNLLAAARQVQARWGGRLPCDPARLRELPGLGRYTAAAVASIAFAVPVAVVDGNVIRVVSRLLADAGDPASPAFRRRLASFVESTFGGNHPGWVNQAWMELGALVCRPFPDCPACPLRLHCRAAREGRTGELPSPRRRRAVPVRRGMCLLVVPPGVAAPEAAAPWAVGESLRSSGTALALLRRPGKGLLGGLWELPNFLGEAGEEERFLQESSLTVLREFREELRHRYSHFEVRLRPVLARAGPDTRFAGWPEQRWVLPHELATYPRPRVHIRAMELFDLTGYSSSP